MRPVQYFSKEYLEQCSRMTPEQIVAFLEQFRLLHGGQKNTKSRLISIKVPEDMLEAFKIKAKLHQVPYQTQIKRLMKDWLE